MLVTETQLENFVCEVLEALQVPLAAARRTARVLVAADLRGIESHGVSRLAVYVKNLRSGRFNATAELSVRVSGATAQVDGQNGLGAFVAAEAMQVAIGLARDFGVGAVAVRNSTHFGMASCYTEMAVKEQMIGIALSNTPSAMPPSGGSTPFFGTNPLAFSFPAAGDPIEIDMSTSVVARGRVIAAARDGEPIPEGFALDADGRPTTSAVRALAGTLLPAAGPKGYALALAVELLCAVLTASPWGPDVGYMYDEGTEPIGISHFLIALDVRRFLEWEDWLSLTQRLRTDIKAVRRVPGMEEILLPGERRARTMRERMTEGIPLPETVARELQDLGQSLGVVLWGLS